MAIYTKGENLFGYNITVWSGTGRTMGYSGWSEGDPLLNNKIRAKLIKTFPVKALKALVGGGTGVSAAFAVAGFTGSALGQTISAMLMKSLKASLLRQAESKLLLGGTNIGVTIAGDFEAVYSISNSQDLKALPGFLSIIPAKFQLNNKPYWMGKAILGHLINDQLGAILRGGNVNIRYTVDV